MPPRRPTTETPPETPFAAAPSIEFDTPRHFAEFAAALRAHDDEAAETIGQKLRLSQKQIEFAKLALQVVEPEFAADLEAGEATREELEQSRRRLDALRRFKPSTLADHDKWAGEVETLEKKVRHLEAIEFRATVAKTCRLERIVPELFGIFDKLERRKFSSFRIENRLMNFATQELLIDPWNGSWLSPGSPPRRTFTLVSWGSK